jgi:hypothetical protein
MITKISIICFLFILCFVTNVYLVERNYLLNEFNSKDGVKSFANITEWRIKFIEKLHKELEQMPTQAKTELIADAEKENQLVWPTLPLMDFLEFNTNGDRIHYETLKFDRLIKLKKLVIGELLTNTGEYMPQIANGLWLVLEQSRWVIPAHQPHNFPLLEPPTIDLFAAESAELISYIQLLLG